MNGNVTSRLKATIANWADIAYMIPRTNLDLCKNIIAKFFYSKTND